MITLSYRLQFNESSVMEFMEEFKSSDCFDIWILVQSMRHDLVEGRGRWGYFTDCIPLSE